MDFMFSCGPNVAACRCYGYVNTELRLAARQCESSASSLALLCACGVQRHMRTQMRCSLRFAGTGGARKTLLPAGQPWRTTGLISVRPIFQHLLVFSLGDLQKDSSGSFRVAQVRTQTGFSLVVGRNTVPFYRINATKKRNLLSALWVLKLHKKCLAHWHILIPESVVSLCACRHSGNGAQTREALLSILDKTSHRRIALRGSSYHFSSGQPPGPTLYQRLFHLPLLTSSHRSQKWFLQTKVDSGALTFLLSDHVRARDETLQRDDDIWCSCPDCCSIFTVSDEEYRWAVLATKHMRQSL